MEKIAQLEASNSKLQVEIDSWKQIVENINSVDLLSGDIDWQKAVALSCVVSYCEGEIELLLFQKEGNVKFAGSSPATIEIR